MRRARLGDVDAYGSLNPTEGANVRPSLIGVNLLVLSARRRLLRYIGTSELDAHTLLNPAERRQPQPEAAAD